MPAASQKQSIYITKGRRASSNLARTLVQLFGALRAMVEADIARTPLCQKTLPSLHWRPGIDRNAIFVFAAKSLIGRIPRFDPNANQSHPEMMDRAANNRTVDG